MRRAASLVEGRGVVGGSEAAAAAGEDGEGARDLGADGVDGADVEAVGMIEQRPAELAVALEDGEGEGAGLRGRRYRMRHGKGVRDWAASRWARTRSRISAVALLVKVMARTCSGW